MKQEVKRVAKARKNERKGVMFKSAVVHLIGLSTLAIVLLVCTILLITIGIEKPVEKEVVKEVPVEVVKEVRVVDETKVDMLANAKFNEYVATYQASLTEETEPVVQTEIIYVVDDEEVDRLAEEKAQAMFEEYLANLEPTVVTVEVEKEVIKEVEVEKEVIKEVEVPVEVQVEVIKEVPVEVIKEVQVEVPVETIVEVEKIVEVPVEVEKIVEKEVIVEKEIEVEKIVEIEKPVEVEVIKEVEVVDYDEVQRLAEEMNAEYKAQVDAEAEEAANRTSKINVQVTVKYVKDGKNWTEYETVSIEGKIYTQLTSDMIYEALYASNVYMNNERVNVTRFANKEAVELFAGFDYDSTRLVYLTVYLD